MKYEIFIFEKNKIMSFYKKAADEYQKRLSRYCSLSSCHVKKQRDWEKRWMEAAEKILLLPGKDSVSSEDFSRQLGQWEMKGCGKVSFFIPDLSQQEEWSLALKARQADWRIMNLSDLTLGPGMVQVVLLEQIYRGYRIMHHHPYHK